MGNAWLCSVEALDLTNSVDWRRNQFCWDVVLVLRRGWCCRKSEWSCFSSEARWQESFLNVGQSSQLAHLGTFAELGTAEATSLKIMCYPLLTHSVVLGSHFVHQVHQNINVRRVPAWFLLCPTYLQTEHFWAIWIGASTLRPSSPGLVWHEQAFHFRKRSSRLNKLLIFVRELKIEQASHFCKRSSILQLSRLPSIWLQSSRLPFYCHLHGPRV